MKLNLNLTDAGLLSEKSVLPTGVYNVECIKSESSETSKGGGMLVLTLKVADGEHAGKQYTERLNIVNSNPDAMKFAYKTLKTILTKAGHHNPNALADDQEVVGLKYQISVQEIDSPWENDKGEKIESTENKLIAIYEFNTQATSSAEPKTAAKTSPVATTASPFGKQETATEAAPATKAPVAESAAAQEFPWSK